jgi:dinuclear metal center YbgI/SA1388 family protein
MPRLNEITAYLDDFLNVAKIDDSSFNGLHVEGEEKVRKIAFAVDVGAEVFDSAARESADMLVVHHGLFWKNEDSRFASAMKDRLKILISSNISLYAVHLPLDINAEVGNNVELIRIAGAQICGRFLSHGSDFVGAVGKLSTPQNVLQLAEILENKLETKTQILGGGREVSIVAAASGACNREAVFEAECMGADLLITGEKRDFYHLANDLGISVIFAGHHASEQVGIWALQKHICKKFPDVECVYIKCPTDL